jgi:integrase
VRARYAPVRTPLAQIDQDAIDKGARKLYPKASPATRNRQFYTPAAAVIWHAARRGWCERPVIGRPEPGPERVRRLTHEEADRLIAACNEHLRPLVIFPLYTGARAGEALWLDWADLDVSRARVTFHETKNGRARGVPLHRRVVVALSNLSHRDGSVFRRPDGMPYERPAEDDDEDTSAGTRIKKAFNGACRELESPTFVRRLPAHLGQLALSRESRPDGVAGVGRLPAKAGGNLGASASVWTRKSSNQ